MKVSRTGYVCERQEPRCKGEAPGSKDEKAGWTKAQQSRAKVKKRWRRVSGVLCDQCQHMKERRRQRDMLDVSGIVSEAEMIWTCPE